MKKYLFMCLMALVPLAFTACGSDDDNNNLPNPNEDVDITVDKATFTESGNTLKLVYNINVKGSTSGKAFAAKDEWTCEFNGSTLVKSTHRVTFPSADYAKEAYADYVKTYGNSKCSVSGNVLTYEDTAEWEDQSKDEIKMIMQMMASGK